MKCNACSTQWSGSDAYCPNCGSPSLNPHRIRLWEIIWVCAAIVLIIYLMKLK